MTARRLVLVRHGRPEVLDGVPAAAWPLSAAGRDAAAMLAEALRDFTFASIASSPEPKAVATAAALARGMASGASDVMAVTHGTIMSIYLGRTCGIDPLPFWRALPMPAAAIVEGGRLRLIGPARPLRA